jgi:glycosyltransferase involved in cell wall biosynthesis
MDRDMPPRIAYWTSAFEPKMEAISSEVELLQRHYPSSVAWGLSHRHWCLISLRRRGWCVHPRLHLLFRGVTRVLEPVFDLNHIFGSVGDWFYLEGRKRRPTVLTAAAVETPVARSLLERVDRFVVEYPAGRDRLEEQGIDRSRIRLIFPPFDLNRFTPEKTPDGRFTVLFASSPERSDWLESRGVRLLIDAAALRPDIHFRLLCRPWGDSLPEIRRWIQERGLDNVEVLVGRIDDMPAQYKAVHVTIAPFTQIERCKPMPNSLIESLACGRPVLCTPDVGLAEMVCDAQAGIVGLPLASDLAEGLDRIRASWSVYSRNARNLAERWFSEDHFLDHYHALYQEVIPR